MAQGLAGRGIHFVVTKGMTFESTLYGSLGTRHMNDIDFMIAPRDREAVLSVMQELGFRPFFEWAKDARREEISSRLNRDHLPKLAREIDQPGTRTIQIDVANSLTWTKSPFDVPVEEALERPCRAARSRHARGEHALFPPHLSIPLHRAPLVPRGVAAEIRRFRE